MAARAANVMRAVALGARAASAEELREALGATARAILDAQPAMAPVVALARAVLDATRTSRRVEDVRAEAARAAERFGAEIQEWVQQAAKAAGSVLPESGSILTVSSSSTVRRTLLEGARGRELRVVCLEGRPRFEGRTLAAGLADAGIRTTVAVDAAATSLVPDCALVLIGADSIGDLGVVNKIGSTAASEAARRAGVPVRVVTDRTKILPPGFPQRLTDDRPPGEVWRAPKGVDVWNRYFEAVPLAWITTVLTDVGEFTPEELERHRRTLELPEALRGWSPPDAVDAPREAREW